MLISLCCTGLAGVAEQDHLSQLLQDETVSGSWCWADVLWCHPQSLQPQVSSCHPLSSWRLAQCRQLQILWLWQYIFYFKKCHFLHVLICLCMPNCKVNAERQSCQNQSI